MKPLLFSLFDNEVMVNLIQKKCGYEIGEIIFQQFPDQETLVKINSDVKDRKVIFVANLSRPDKKILPLLFAAKTARDLGAKEITLVAPYLVYMRQDKQFHSGEGITSKYFAEIISRYFNKLITVDPHLHRYDSLNEIYKIPSVVLHAVDPIADWIEKNVDNPIIIGPDDESGQWVRAVAKQIHAPVIVLEKMRKGDRSVEVSIPQMAQYKNNTPILLDDIISSGKTMIESIKHLNKMQTKKPVCIGIHAVFAENAYEDLLQAGVDKMVTCNTIPHVSNAIDLSVLIAGALEKRPC